MKKFEKVEKTGIISTKFSLRCTPSVILGCNVLKRDNLTGSENSLLVSCKNQKYTTPFDVKIEQFRKLFVMEILLMLFYASYHKLGSGSENSLLVNLKTKNTVHLLNFESYL